ncbi:MAG: HupE/UreJ family protein [Ignavibacteria bacterium]
MDNRIKYFLFFSLMLVSGSLVSHPMDMNLEKISTSEVSWVYLKLGFTHILPLGIDHILFVLGLFLLSPKLKPLLQQITCFTIAHTITLGLAVYNIVSLPSYIVEPIIAASIIYVALENLRTQKLNKWRLVIVFLFGLIHGMGFAGALKELGLPKSQFLNALLTFNLGVELGQVTVVLTAFLAVGLWFKSREWYHKRIVIPASLIIAVIAAYWTVERIFF